MSCWAAAARSGQRRRARSSSELAWRRGLLPFAGSMAAHSCQCRQTPACRPPPHPPHWHLPLPICCREMVPTARGIELAIFDLADLGSVREWAKRAQDFGLPLDLLVNNAGAGCWAPAECAALAAHAGGIAAVTGCCAPSAAVPAGTACQLHCAQLPCS